MDASHVAALALRGTVLAVTKSLLEAAQKRLGHPLARSFCDAYEEATNHPDPSVLSVFHPTMFRVVEGGVAVGTSGEEILVLRGDELFVGDEVVAANLAELLATESYGYDETTVVELTCPFCGEVDAITIDTSGGATQTFIEDCSICCHPRVIHVENGAVRVERA